MGKLVEIKNKETGNSEIIKKSINPFRQLDESDQEKSQGRTRHHDQSGEMHRTDLLVTDCKNIPLYTADTLSTIPIVDMLKGELDYLEKWGSNIEWTVTKYEITYAIKKINSLSA